MDLVTYKLAKNYADTVASKVTDNGIITVAPHNSLSKSKASHTLPGMDDQVELNKIIQEACSNPNSSFGNWMVPKIQILDGDVNLSDSIILRNGTFIAGCGYGTRFYLQSGSNKDMFVSHGYEGGNIYHLMLRDFKVEGNYEGNTEQEYWGIKIKAQKFMIQNITVESCHSGIKLNGGNVHSGCIRDCFIQNNYFCGMVSGENTIIINNFFVNNVNDNVADWGWNACALLLDSRNVEIINNQFDWNGVDILAHWAVNIIVAGNLFKSSRLESIAIRGRAWGIMVNNNRFRGRRHGLPNEDISIIKFKEIDSNEGAHYNQICNNIFAAVEDPDTGCKYCIEETANCDQNYIANNIFRGSGYTQPTPVLKVGTNTVDSPNMI